MGCQQNSAQIFCSYGHVDNSMENYNTGMKQIMGDWCDTEADNCINTNIGVVVPVGFVC